MVRNINKLTRTVTVELDSGKEVSFSTALYDPLQLGYAATTHKSQGMTTDRTYILLGDTMQDRHLSYVQLSRHRQEAELFCDRDTAGRDFADLSARMEREQEAKLALEIAKEAERNREEEQFRQELGR